MQIPPPFVKCVICEQLRMLIIFLLYALTLMELDYMHYYCGKKQMSNTIYNLFSSAMLHWPNSKLIHLLLDPMSQFQHKDISPHPNLELDMLSFVQDFIFGLHCQCQVFYGEWSGSWWTKIYGSWCQPLDSTLKII